MGAYGLIVDALLMFMASFGFIFLKSYQTQVIIGGHYAWAFFVSMLMSVTQVLTVTLIVTSGWASLPPLALGGSLGVVTAMFIYRKQHRKK